MKVKMAKPKKAIKVKVSIKPVKKPKPVKPVKVAKVKGKNKIERVLHEFKEGSLHSSSKKGPKVKNRKQALAIALNEQRAFNQGKRKELMSFCVYVL